MGNQVNSDDYYKFALHWNFPQAYYSVYLTMTAFHETQGIANEQHEKSIKLFGNSVKDNHYPVALGFHATGLYEAFQFKGLSTFKKFPKDCTGLSRIDSLDEAQTQIAMFLKSTRFRKSLARNIGILFIKQSLLLLLNLITLQELRQTITMWKHLSMLILTLKHFINH
ncbi:MAG: hypothetical protein IPO16_09870 [Saprospiraceae bacterium]|nr:hypothetical protein [Saprospiraceae bacterium]